MKKWSRIRTRGRQTNKSIFLVGLSMASVLLLMAGCGSSSSTGGSSTAATKANAGTSKAADAHYESAESGLPSHYPVPQKKAGFQFTVGYLQPAKAVPVLAAEEEGAVDEVRALGGKVISKDANFNLQTQVSQFHELLAEGVDAILAYPVSVAALSAPLAEAKAKGVPVVTVGAPPTAVEPPISDISANVLPSYDAQALAVAQAVAAERPGATFAVLGTAFVAPALEYYEKRVEHWGKRLGLKFAGREDVQEDTPAAGSTAMSSLVSKYPDLEAVFTYNDISAVAAGTAARSAGKEILVAGASGGESPAFKAIEAGTVFATYQVPWREIGKNMTDAAYNLITKQNLPIAPTVALEGTVVTKENVSGLEAIG